MRLLQKYLALTPAGRTIILRSLVLLPVVATLIGMRGMARTMSWLERLGQRLGGGDPYALPPREIARLINAAASLLRVRCLPRSLVLWHSLRARGTLAEIRLGVSQPADGGLLAHAWVELDGLPLNDSLDVLDRYTVLPSFAVKLGSGYRGALES